MPLLEMRDAAFDGAHATALAPVSLVLDEGERRAVACTDGARAALLGLLAAGLLRPTSGRVFVAAFDPVIQPVQVKRITGYVPHDAVAREFASFTAYVEYRAALWSLPRAQTIVRARALLDRLDGVHEAFAFPLVGALLANPRLLVLDRPQAVYAHQICAAADSCAILSTHANERDAQAFTVATPVPA